MSNPLKKTMVYLGLADEELEYDEQPQPQHQPTQHQSPVAPVPHPAPVAPAPGRAPVTPLRKSNSARNATVQEMNEILTVHPRQYRDAQVIAESFREGIPVIINLSQMSEGDMRSGSSDVRFCPDIRHRRRLSPSVRFRRPTAPKFPSQGRS